MITDNIGMTMKYPTMKQILSYDLTKMQTMEHLVLSMIVWKTSLMMNEIYDEMSKKELTEFVEQMTTDQFAKSH